jgi:hypothetical protein
MLGGRRINESVDLGRDQHSQRMGQDQIYLMGSIFVFFCWEYETEMFPLKHHVQFHGLLRLTTAACRSCLGIRTNTPNVCSGTIPSV